jgi:inosine-uridine nucleoside N-ribohydrolase
MRQKIHLDTDIGGDLDDLCALAYCLRHPEAELIAVTTVAEHGGRRAGYVRHVLHLAGRQDIPVAAGVEARWQGFRFEQPLPDEHDYWRGEISPFSTPLEQALDLLEASIRQGAHVVAIGAYTHLAMLEERQPGILADARITLMGGFIHPPRAGFPAWDFTADWNAQVDSASAHLVFERANPTLVPLAVTAETALRFAHLPALEQAGALGECLAHQARVFASAEQVAERYLPDCPALPSDFINFQHDPLACAAALGWSGLTFADLRLRVEMERGWVRLREDPHGRVFRVAVGVDGEAFAAHWLETVCR